MDVRAFVDGLVAGKRESLHVPNPAWLFFSGHHRHTRSWSPKLSFESRLTRAKGLSPNHKGGAKPIMFYGEVVHILGGPYSNRSGFPDVGQSAGHAITQRAADLGISLLFCSYSY